MFRYLYSNQLSGTIPSSIGNLAQLLTLYVHSCFQFHQQTHIKLTLSTHISLFLCVIMFRDLSVNQLTGTIPSSIGYLAQLQSLYVHSCFQFRQRTHIKLTISTHQNLLFQLFACLFSCFRTLYKNLFSGVIPQEISHPDRFSQSDRISPKRTGTLYIMTRRDVLFSTSRCLSFAPNRFSSIR